MSRKFIPILAAMCSFMLSSVSAAECDRISAENLNSSIRANFTLMKDINKQDGLEPEEIDRLREKFEASRRLHADALAQENQENLNRVCEDYRSILSQQEAMRQ